MKNVIKFVDEHAGVTVCGILAATCTVTVVMYKKFLDKLYGDDFLDDEVYQGLFLLFEKSMI